MLEPLLLALERLPWIVQLRTSIWVYPLVNTAHLLGISLLLGTILAFDVRLLGWRRDVSAQALARVLLPLARVGFVLAVLTGIGLFMVRASEYAYNPIFLAKMGVIALALLNLWLLRRTAGWSKLPASGKTQPRVRFGGAMSAVLWMLVLLLGRLIGYR